jgi:6-pyruvoyl-tetrahydropterin synthase
MAQNDFVGMRSSNVLQFDANRRKPSDIDLEALVASMFSEVRDLEKMVESLEENYAGLQRALTRAQTAIAPRDQATTVENPSVTCASMPPTRIASSPSRAPFNGASANTKLRSTALTYSISVDSFFNARHQVTINGSKGPLHAHSWRVRLKLRQTSDIGAHALFGFAEAKRLLNDQITPYDGKVLNNLPQFSSVPPTTENLAAILFVSVKVAASDLRIIIDSITVWESPTISVTCSESQP